MRRIYEHEVAPSEVEKADSDIYEDIAPDENLISLDDAPSKFESFEVYDGYRYLPEQIYLRKELNERLYKALDSISERESVYLKYRYGFVNRFRSREETAKLFSLTESRAKKLEKGALKRMRRLME